MTLATVTLDDKYVQESGRIYLSGIQALVRLPLMQRQRDKAAGLNTGGVISGDRGSPPGGCDKPPWPGPRLPSRAHNQVPPGVREGPAARPGGGRPATPRPPRARP